jgi:chromosome segregation ATPase
LEAGSSSITRQYQQSIATIDDLEKQLRGKNETITRLQAEALTKDEQAKVLQSSVDGYSLKIDALSDELARLERTHKVETIRIVDREDPTLRFRLDQLASLNSALTADNVSLRGQAELSRGLERRAALLE